MSIYVQIGNRLHINPKELERFIKFGAVGAFGSVVDFGFYNLLIPVFADASGQAWLTAISSRLPAGNSSGLSLAPALAGTCSFILAIISNFIWNRYWTYPDSRSKKLLPQFIQFFLINALGILIRIPIITFTHEPFANLANNLIHTGIQTSVTIGNNLALALAIGIVMLWNFFVNRRITYNDVD